MFAFFFFVIMSLGGVVNRDKKKTATEVTAFVRRQGLEPWTH